MDFDESVHRESAEGRVHLRVSTSGYRIPCFAVVAKAQCIDREFSG
jgi:hypothetical protein